MKKLCLFTNIFTNFRIAHSRMILLHHHDIRMKFSPEHLRLPPSLLFFYVVLVGTSSLI